MYFAVRPDTPRLPADDPWRPQITREVHRTPAGRIDFAACVDLGTPYPGDALVRPVDAWRYVLLRDHLVLMIAHGKGHTRGCGLAAIAAANEATAYLERHPGKPDLQGAVDAANTVLAQGNDGLAPVERESVTLDIVALGVRAGACEAEVAHIGDGRVFLFRRDEFRPGETHILTTDHSYPSIILGEDAEAARLNEKRHQLVHLLDGYTPLPELVTRRHAVVAGDRLALMTANVWSHFTLRPQVELPPGDREPELIPFMYARDLGDGVATIMQAARLAAARKAPGGNRTLVAAEVPARYV